MVLPIICYQVGPETKSYKAIARAGEIVEQWLETGLYHGHKEKGREVCVGWAYAALQGAIASEILAQQGLSIDDLEEALQGAATAEERDVLAAWETRVRP